MKIYKYPSRKEWAQIIARPHIDAKELAGMVKNILDDVKANGDEAVKRYEKNLTMPNFRVFLSANLK